MKRSGLSVDEEGAVVRCRSHFLPIVLAGGGRFVAVRGVLVVVVTFSVVVTATARVVRGVVHSGNTSFVVFLESGLISGISVVV